VTIGGDRPENFSFIGAKRYSYGPWCSTIVLSDRDGWIELRCCECGGNVSPSTNGLMRGPGAFYGHLTSSHDYPTMSMSEVINKCSIRKVTDEEVRDICKRKDSGMLYIDLVVAKAKTTEPTETARSSNPGPR